MPDENNLYLNFLNKELETKILKEILEDINKACGTSYNHSWPSKMRKTGYEIERIPKNVRQYMMRIVFPEVTHKKYSKKELNRLINSLT